MKIPFQCHRCEQSTRVWVLAEISDAGIHAGVCPAGHEVRFRLSFEPAHKLLLDVGALAILDGYYREAVSSFAAGLEQSFEFYVEASMAAAGVSQEAIRRLLSANRFDQRRAGMVAACYLRDTGKEFPYLQSKRIEFRNRVIHNANWPTRTETIEFAGYVCASILGLHHDLGPKMSALLALKEEQADLSSADDLIADRDAPATLFARPSLLLEVESATDFESALSSFARKNWWNWPPLRSLSNQPGPAG